MECQRCKELFEGHFAQKYCDVCREIRKREKLSKGVHKVRQCRECLKDFKPSHHATKYCTRCKVKQKRPRKEIVATDLADYINVRTDGLRDIADFHILVVRDKVKTNPKGGRGNKGKHVPATIDQRQKSAIALKEMVIGRAPTGTLRPPKDDEFKPQFIDAGDSVEGIGVINEEAVDGEA